MQRFLRPLSKLGGRSLINTTLSQRSRQSTSQYLFWILLGSGHTVNIIGGRINNGLQRPKRTFICSGLIINRIYC